MNKLICKCCGGQIDKITFRCKFCGTEYDLLPAPYKIETFRYPVEHFAATFNLSEELLHKMDPVEAGEIAVRELIRELSKSIPICMKITMSEDFYRMGVQYRGDIRMIRPQKEGD